MRLLPSELQRWLEELRLRRYADLTQYMLCSCASYRLKDPLGRQETRPDERDPGGQGDASQQFALLYHRHAPSRYICGNAATDKLLLVSYA